MAFSDWERNSNHGPLPLRCSRGSRGGGGQQENSKFQTRNVLIKSPVPHSVMILLADCM